MTIYPGGPQDGIMYTMTAPDGNIATFNNPADANYVGMAWFSGTDSADIRESIDVRAGADGSVQGLNFRGSRPVVGNVEIVATSTTDRNNKFTKLRRAANALRSDGTLDFTPDGGIASRIFFRLNGPIRRADERGWKYTVQFPLMSADPYIYGQALNTTTDSSSPFSFTATNQGDGLSAPNIDVTVNALTAVTVTNQVTGQSVNLQNVDPANLVTWLMKFGPGTGAGQMYFPTGISVDSSGNIFVAEYLNGAVRKYNSAGVYQSTIGTQGTADGQLYYPMDCAHDASNNLFVADWGNNRVQKFNSAGAYQAKTSTSMSQCNGVAVDSTGAVYATAFGSHQVFKYANTLGAASATVGGLGTGTNQYNSPRGIAVDSSNNVFVVDTVNKRVQKLTSGLAYTSQFSTVQSDGSGNNPAHIAIDSANSKYVTDFNANVVQKYSSSDVYQIRIGSFGTDNGQFQGPNGVAASGTTLYVGEGTNPRVQTFNVAAGSGIISLNFGTGAVRASNGINLYRYVDVPTTTWWALQPGDNPIQVTGTGVTSVTATWRDAWL